MIEIEISETPLNVSYCISKVLDPECGGIATFIGTVRNQTAGKNVVRLEFESYSTMAVRELKKIAEYAADTFGVKNMIIQHRTGILQVGDLAVIIAAGAPHRPAALDACRYAIDTLKETVPIWKKEIFEDGEVWVASHP